MLIPLLVVADMAPFESAMESHKYWICLFYSHTENKNNVKSVYHSYCYAVFIWNLNTSHFSIFTNNQNGTKNQKEGSFLKFLIKLSRFRGYLKLGGQVEMRRAAHRCPEAPSILPKSRWEYAHPAHLHRPSLCKRCVVVLGVLGGIETGLELMNSVHWFYNTKT